MADAGRGPMTQILAGHAKQIFIVLEIKAMAFV